MYVAPGGTSSESVSICPESHWTMPSTRTYESWAPAIFGTVTSATASRQAASPRRIRIERTLPRVKARDDFLREARELIQHVVGRDHGPEDELRGAAADVFLESLDEHLGGAKRGTLVQGGVVGAVPRNERRGDRFGC